MAKNPILGAKDDMTSQEIKLIHESWKLVEENKVENGKTLFYRLFSKNPGVQQLFSFAKDLSIEELQSNAGLVKHATSVMNTVGSVIQKLEKDGSIQSAIPVLVGLGKKHIKYGVKPEYLGPLGEAIIFMLKKSTGNKFFAETEAAWTKLYGIISDSVARGLKGNE